MVRVMVVFLCWLGTYIKTNDKAVDLIPGNANILPGHGDRAIAKRCGSATLP